MVSIGLVECQTTAGIACDSQDLVRPHELRQNAAANARSSETPVQQSQPSESHRPPAPTAVQTKGAERTPPTGAARPALSVYQLRFVTSLRKEPNFSSVVLAKLAIGAKVALLESRGEWIEVRDESSGRSGFIRKEFITSR